MTLTYPEPEKEPTRTTEGSVAPGPQGYSAAPPSSEGSSYPSYPPGQQPSYSPEHPNATMVLLLGIVGILIPIVSFIGWYVGSSTKKEAAAQGYQTGGNLQIGWVLSVAFSILQIFSVVMFFFIFVAFGLFAIA